VFKWLVLKTGMAVMRSTSSLFAMTYNREMFREVLDLVHDPSQATTDMFKIGYLAARESAVRQAAVFKLFPSNPTKLIEYIPLLYQIVLGIPMENYEMEWDKSNPNLVKALFKVPKNPMEYGIGNDPERDNLPFQEFWDGENGYSAIVMGMLTQCTSYVLETRNIPLAVKITNKLSKIRGEGCYGILCEVIPRDQLPKYDYLGEIESESNIPKEISGDTNTSSTEDLNANEPTKNEASSESSPESQFQKFFNNFSIDTIEDLLSSPTAGLEMLIKKAVESSMHMTTVDLIDHFTNYEDDFVRILGFLIPHFMNEVGQLPKKMLENDKIARFYGHFYLNLVLNAKKYISTQVIQDLRSILVNSMENLAPETFVLNLKNFSPDQLLEFFFEGMKKAWQDLGVKFDELKGSLAEEFQQNENIDGIDLSAQNKTKRDAVIFELIEEMMGLTFLVSSMPGQLTFLLSYNTYAGITDLLNKLFTNIKESGQKVVDLIEQLKN
jgi:hypothetical protein